MQELTIRTDEVFAVNMLGTRYYVKGSKSGRLVVLTADEYQADDIARVLKNYRSVDETE